MTDQTTESATETPLHLQGREAVIAAAAPEDWRDGAPDYHLSHQVMPVERTTQHAPDSLEHIVEELVKVFEMEVSHKHDPAKWVSLVAEHYRGRVNGGAWQDAEEFARIGSYNILIGENPYYTVASETFESSHHIFHTAFPGGFFWEVLEVLMRPAHRHLQVAALGSLRGRVQGPPAHR